MTVAELVKLLGEYPADLRVVVDGYEAGFDDVESERIAVRPIRLDANPEWYYGQHGDADEPGAGTVVVNALVLGRDNLSRI